MERWNQMDVNGIFNPQNRFWSFMEKIMNLCALSLLWLLFSIPILTAGASTVAMFQYTLKLSRDEEGYVWKTFIRGFLKNFIQATILWLILAAALLFLSFDLYCCQFITFSAGARWGARILILSLILLTLMAGLYLFPLTAFFHTTVRRALVHSFIMAVGNLYVTVTIMVIYAAGAVMTYFIPPLFMVWFTFASYGASHLFGFVFRRYIQNDSQNPDLGADIVKK